MSAIHVDVRHRLGEFDLFVSFATAHGITALYGRSGAGKTTIINMVAGLLTPTQGKIRINDNILFDSETGLNVPAHQRRVGCVFQDARLFPHLSVKANLAYGMHRDPPQQKTDLFENIVSLLALGGMLTRHPNTLSGGERQRVAIGRALLSRPRALLMDEPLASLDAEHKAELLPYIESLRDEVGLPILYVSHAQEEVVRLADSVVMLQNGQVTATGSVEDMLGRVDLYPLSGRYEAGAVITCTVDRHDNQAALTTLRFAGGILLVPRIDIATGHSLRIRIRARDVSIATERPEHISIRNILKGQVTEITDSSGAFAEVRISIGKTALVSRVTRLSVRDLRIEPGCEVFALIKSIAIDRDSLGMLAPNRYLPRT